MSSVNTERIAELGEAVYERQIKSFVEPQLNGKFMAIDVGSGRYEIGDRIATALEQARAKLGDRPFYVKRIGFSAAATIGGFATR